MESAKWMACSKTGMRDKSGTLDTCTVLSVYDIIQKMTDTKSNFSRREFLRGASAGAVCCSFSPSLFAAAMAPSPRPKTLVLCGTAFGLGAAVANPGRCVVIERSLPEFSQVGDWGELGDASTEQGKALAEAIRSVGLVTDGRLELPPLSDFLHQYAAEKGVSFFCCADLVSFKRNANSCRAVVCGGGSSGLCEVEAASLLDTSSIGWRDCGLGEVESRNFSAVTLPGLVSVDLPANATRREARLKLWDRIKPLKGGDKAIAEVNELGTVYRRKAGGTIKKKVDGNWTWIPSAQFVTFMSAFEEGLKCALA